MICEFNNLKYLTKQPYWLYASNSILIKQTHLVVFAYLPHR